MDPTHVYRKYACNIQTYYLNAIKGFYTKDATITGILDSPLTTDLAARLLQAEQMITTLQEEIAILQQMVQELQPP